MTKEPRHSLFVSASALSLTAAGLLLGVSPAQSQIAGEPASEAAGDEASAPRLDAGDIVVTAQKRSESVNKVGMSITAFSGDQLVRQGVVDTSQLIKVVPGFNFTQSAYATPVYTIRGIGFQENSLAASPAVSIYVDEVPIPFPAEADGAALDLERVEVLKGPQGTLYGQNSTGGAVNYIAAKPTDRLAAGVDLSYGRFNTVDAQAYVSGPLSDTLKVRLAVRGLRGDDWQRSYTRNDTLGRQAKVQGRLLIDWQPLERLKISINLNAWRDRSDTPAAQAIGIAPQTDLVPIPAGLQAYPLAPRSSRAADWDPNTSFRRDNYFLHGSARLDYSLTDDVTITSISAYQYFDRDQPIDSDGTSFQNFYVLQTGHVSTFFQELRLSGDFGSAGHWIVGGNYSSDRTLDSNLILFRDSSSSSALGLPLTDLVNQTRQNIKTAAIYGNVDYEIAPSVTLHGGLRYTDVRRSFAGCSFDAGSGEASAVFGLLSNVLRGVAGPSTLAPGACGTILPDLSNGIVRDRLNQDNISWRAGLDWQVDPQTLLYANVSRGYKSGSFPTLSASSSVQFSPVTQETVLAFEAGFKLSLLDRKVQLNGAGFYYKYEDKQIRGKLQDPIFGNLEALINIPKSHIQGFELSAVLRPVEGLTISPAVTHILSEIDGTFSNFTPLGVQGNFAGERFPYTPKWSGNLDAEYRWAMNDRVGFFIGANANHQGATNGGFGELPEFRVRSYTLIDVRAGIEDPSGKWRIGAFGRNITNQYYWSSASHLVDVITRYAGIPATYGVQFSYKY
ncbi:TonB-dependent receptor [Sphingobium sp. TB-6]|uniref:TonB-dependent receptor n=1 Tax=Sphingobium sp. TB-6 TaxID=2728850 RepID=UPI00146C84C9|nr:TonB-dependent receptor [Sphingobium sp. TB-6]NML90670.1 TonB-dependent receptor [Sphingobium sp. TB-6]